MKNSKLKQLVIWGAGGHAMVVADIVRLQGEYQIVGFLDDVNLDRQGTLFAEARVLGGSEQLDRLIAKGATHGVLAFGDCRARKKLGTYLCSKGFSLITAIHPSAVVATDAMVGAGTVLMAGVVINPGVRVGENVIVNTCASIDHECTVHDAAHIAPGVRLGGRVEVGEMATVGIGAVVAADVKVGEGAIIGAGSVVLNDIPPKVVAYGVPARMVREVESDKGVDSVLSNGKH